MATADTPRGTRARSDQIGHGPSRQHTNSASRPRYAVSAKWREGARARWWLQLQAQGAGAVWLELPTTASSSRCLSEEIQSNVVVMGDYAILFEEQPTRPMVSAKVTSPYGNVLHRSSRVTQGQFAFTTAEAGMYQACFWADTTDMVINLNLDWKLGIAAKDWDALAKKEKLEGVALELVKLESAVQAIRENLLLLRYREEAMAEISEWTNLKVTLLSLMSLVVCIIVSYAQLWYLTVFPQEETHLIRSYF